MWGFYHHVDQIYRCTFSLHMWIVYSHLTTLSLFYVCMYMVVVSTSGILNNIRIQLILHIQLNMRVKTEFIQSCFSTKGQASRVANWWKLLPKSKKIGHLRNKKRQFFFRVAKLRPIHGWKKAKFGNPAKRVWNPNIFCHTGRPKLLGFQC